MDEQSIFLGALERGTPQERAAWLDEACGGDEPQKQRILQLLQKHEQANSFLEKPAHGLDETVGRGMDDNRAASMDAGLATAFSADKAVVIGDANHSVLKVLGKKLNEVPRVSLRESAAEAADPITRPNSPEMPKSDSDSRYRLDGEIARGGMGAIIKGRDTDLGRDLAIKVLLESHKDKPEVIQRFVEEAQIGGQLQHPGIAPVYELGQFSDKRPFFSMKLVKGQTLSRLLGDREDASEERARFLGIFEQVCQTMAYAHSRGVIHRDLKPANIMVGAFGEVQVMDWGLAKVLSTGGVADEKKAHNQQQGHSIIQTLRSGVGSDTPAAFGSVGSETQMGSVMGTPAYMPPEQALGEIDNMDERADVFGLGAILCEILTGQPPYVADDGTRIYRMASRGKLDDCFQRLDESGVDADLIAIAKHCLELEPADRPRDAGVLAEKVTEYLESVESRLRETEKQRAAETARAEESRKRARVTLALAVTVLLALGGGGIGWRWMELQRMEHLEAATSNVNDRLSDARLHHGLADGVDVSDEAGLQERIRELSVALESARDAVNLAAADKMPSALRESSSELLATLETDLTSAQQAAERAAADRALALELESIRASRADGDEVARDEELPAVSGTDGMQLAAMPVEEEGERTSLSECYRTAFRNGGLDLAASSREAAADWIRNSPIRETLIAALDEWSRVEISGENGIPPELRSISWSVLEPKELKSAAAKLTPQPDGSILAGPATKEDNHYTIIVQPKPGVVSALRLELLPDESIPNNGLSYHKSGNPHLREVRLFASPNDAPLSFTDAVASYSWSDRPISRAIDDNLATEWHVFDQSRQPQQAVLLLESPVNITAGKTLVIELHQSVNFPLGRFRLSCATDSRELSAWRKTSRKELRALANTADHSKWRKQLRSALAANDIEQLLAMATDEETSHQSPAMIAWLGASLRENSWARPEVHKLSLKLLRDARNRHPSDFWLNYELGMALARPGFGSGSVERKSAGIAYLRTAVALSPRSLIALGALRNSLYWWIREESTSASAEDVAEFVAVVRQIHEVAPNDRHVDLHAASRYFEQKKDWDEGIRVCRTWVELNPESALAHFRLGYCLAWQEKPDDSIAAYQKAIELDPKDYVAHNNIGFILGWQGRLSEAIAAYCNALDINPTYERAHNNLSDTLVRQGRLGEANEECQRVIALYDSLITDETDNVRWLTNRAMAHMAVQQWETAQADWSRAIELDPNQLQQAFKAFSLAKRWPEAVKYGLQYIDADPDNEFRWMEVAPILVQAGETEQYTAFCERAVRQFAATKNSGVSERITKATLLLPNAIDHQKLPTQPFIESVSNGTADAGQQSSFWTTRALLACRTGDAAAAVEYATRSEECEPSDVTRAMALSVLALAEHQQGNTDAATTALQQATELLETLQQKPSVGNNSLQIAKVLHHEAQATIVSDKQPAAEPATPKDTTRE